MDSGAETASQAVTVNDAKITVDKKSDEELDDVVDVVASISLKAPTIATANDAEVILQSNVKAAAEEAEDEEDVEEIVVEELEEEEAEAEEEEEEAEEEEVDEIEEASDTATKSAADATSTVTIVNREVSKDNATNGQTKTITTTTTTTKQTTTTTAEATAPAAETVVITTTPPTPTIDVKKPAVLRQHDDIVEPQEQPIAAVGDEDTKTPANAPLATKAAVELKQADVQQPLEQKKQDNLNNALKEIISDIDSSIQEQENIALLKQQQQELLLKQQDLAKQIQQQQLLAQQLAESNRQQQQQQQQFRQQQQQQQQQLLAPATGFYEAPSAANQQQLSKYSTFEETKDENAYTRKTESYEQQELSNVTKRIDLQKIFTPATDFEEILPKNRKLYASSAFYSPTLHPTVEDQVELARRISHSLSDISNQTSKGQTMYVNRKKRSVKWVHEGSGQDECCGEDYEDDHKENISQLNELSTTATTKPLEKLPLKLLMNPRGQMREFNALYDSLNTESGLLSPEKCAEVVTALNTQKGRGAELFAKRRRKAEKWVIDETNAGTQSPSGLPDYHQYQQRAPTSPSILPAYSDAGKHRVQLNLHQEQLLEKYAKPGLKVIKTPWEAALETGSASSAFVDDVNTQPTLMPQYEQQQQSVQYAGPPAPALGADFVDYPSHNKLPLAYESNKQIARNPQRELAYMPNLARGWNAAGVTLPKALYVPKEIPLESYAPPPSNTGYNKYLPPSVDVCGAHQNFGAAASSALTTNGDAGSFPLTKPNYVGFSSAVAPQSMPKQQHWPASSYQKVPQVIGQTVPQVNFNPSPLPYDKLAKFDSNHNNDSNLRVSSTRSPYGGRKFYNSTSPNAQPTSGIISPDYYEAAPMPRSPLPQKHNQAELLHGQQNFNTLARGWKVNNRAGGFGQSAAGYRPSAKSIALPAAGNLPYTDF